MNWVLVIESAAAFGALAYLLWYLVPREGQRGPTTPASLILLLLLGVQAVVHMSDALQWGGLPEMDQVGDDLRVLVPLLWMLAVFALKSGFLSDELTRQRQQVEFFLEETPLAAVVLTEGGEVVSASRDFAKLSRRSAAEMRGAHILDIPTLPKNLVEHVLDRMASGVETDQSTQAMRVEWGGKVRFVEYNARARAGVGGEEGQITLAVRDVTERVEHEEARRRETGRLFETHRAELVGQLAATVAHDLNNYLHAVTLNAESLADARDEEELREARRVILDGSERASDLLRSLTGIARAKGASEEVDLVALAESTSDLLQRTLPREIELSRAFSSDPVLVFGDRSRLQQALMNLIVNARDAMPDGGHLRLEVRADAEGASLIVQDTGVGIAPSDMDRVFERFFTTKSQQNGTGLGLTLVRTVIEEHEGTVTIHSTVGAGTTIRLLLPVVSKRS